MTVIAPSSFAPMTYSPGRFLLHPFNLLTRSLGRYAISILTLTLGTWAMTCLYAETLGCVLGEIL